MGYTFSWEWFMVGLVILLLGGALALWYRPIADNFGGGVGSYDRYRMIGLLACLLGIVVMVNLHSVVFYWFFSMLFGGGN